jgi:hypothetical protein
MRPPFPHASPLPSFCVVPVRPTPPLAESLRQIIRWWRGDRPTLKQQIQQAKAVALLAEQLEAETERPKAKADRGR